MIIHGNKKPVRIMELKFSTQITKIFLKIVRFQEYGWSGLRSSFSFKINEKRSGTLEIVRNGDNSGLQRIKCFLGFFVLLYFS